MAKKEAAKAKEEKSAPKPVAELILNYPEGKYDAIPLAAAWAKILRGREENRHLTQSELLDVAIRDVLSGEIVWKDVQKALKNKEATETDQLLNGAGKA